MNHTVEKGKTLLVDGPASVQMVSGKVGVFGYECTDRKRIVIRQGKRLPFAVKKAATFDISLGEGSSIEKADGDTIPSSWNEALKEVLKLRVKPLAVMVIGPVDSGKTSFCTFLINRLLSKGLRVAILDGDLGQSDVGPPCTISYAPVASPLTDLFNLRARSAFFVGCTSPNKNVGKVIEGISLLTQEISNIGLDVALLNTDGWVEGEDAVHYKCQLAEEFSPDIVICIQQKDELTPLLDVLGKFRKIVIDSPSAIRQRSREKRKSLRELGYIKYLRNSKVRSIPLRWLRIEEDELIGLETNRLSVRREREICRLLGTEPLHIAEFRDKIVTVVGKRRWLSPGLIEKMEEIAEKKVVVMHKGEEEGVLLALYDAEKNFLGLGSLREVDYARRVIKIYTSVTERISMVTMGRVRLDENLRETPILTEENWSELHDV